MIVDEPFYIFKSKLTQIMNVDAISLEVFKNLFISVAEEMGITLRRAAFSPNIRERLDFSCAVFDRESRMIAQAAHIPVHLGSMPASVASAIETFDQFADGDVIILNDPYHGGTHLPDITMISPVFYAGNLVFFVASRAHHADVGGMSPGSLPLSTELYQEGIIIPPLKLVRAGERNHEILALLMSNSRAPQERLGDFEAQLAAHRVGTIRLGELIQKFGVDLLETHAHALQAYSRMITESVIFAIPDGEYVFSDALEGDGQSEFEIQICVTIRVKDKQLQVDFTGSAPQVAGNVNAVAAIVKSATWYCIRVLAKDDVPVNEGCFEPVEVIIPDGTFLNAHFPAAVAVGNTETGQRVVDTVMGALARALPDRIPAASQGSMNNVTIGGMYMGQQFVYYETIGGGHGASPDRTGLSGRHSHMTNTLNTPVEAIEYSYPLRVKRYGLREGSGGQGRFCGGEGIQREYEFLSTAMVTLNTERRRIAPYGLAGGDRGAVGKNLFLSNNEQISLSGKSTVSARAGDRLLIETPGGGGWGKSLDD